jgi:HAD superfamily phosphoserine phosphatase-like hydrolase
MSQPIVIFDFDGTMIRRDSTLWLIRELLLVSWWKFPVVFAYLVGMFFARSGQPDRLQDLKCRCIGNLIKGKTLNELSGPLDQFQKRVLGVRVERTFDRVVEAVKSGMKVWVVTASPAIAIAHALQDYPLTVSGTSYALQNGRFTGALLGKPCFGEEKVSRVNDWLLSAGHTWGDAVEAWGDSPSDWPLMQKCSKRFWIATVQQKSDILVGIDPEGQHLYKAEQK